MAIFDQQIGYGEEGTWGTRVVPTRFLEFNSEALDRNQDNREGGGLRVGKRVQRSDRQTQRNLGANGKVTHEVANKGYGMLLKHCFGKAPTIVVPTGGVSEMTFTQGDAAGLGLSVQKGVGETSDRVIKPFDYVGSKVATWSLSQKLDDYLMLEMDLDSQDEVTSFGLASASYPTTQKLYHDGMCSATVNAVQVFPSDLDLNVDNNLKLDRYSLRADTRKREPLAGDGLAVIKGVLNTEFESMTSYTQFQAGTIVPIVLTWAGAVISGTYIDTIVITMPVCRIDGETPKIDGYGIVGQQLAFTALWDGTQEPITLLYRTADAAI
jgi:hypothetical protein